MRCGAFWFLGLGIGGHIRCCGCCRWRFRSYSESPFPNAEKVTQKALPRRTARSLELGVPSLRDRSGRSGSGWLRCTYTRCVRLRRTVAALPPPDRSRNEACRRGKRSRARAKAPHPSPLPEGEGTDRGVQAKYADLRYRVECRFWKARKSAPSPSGEGWGEGRIQHRSKADHTLFTTQQ
ncbi:hypothetical protein J2Y39_000894 [Pseudomonas sp. 2957]|nr:hypothetical protein [Pseudomonas sp. 2957]